MSLPILIPPKDANILDGEVMWIPRTEYQRIKALAEAYLALGGKTGEYDAKVAVKDIQGKERDK